MNFLIDESYLNKLKKRYPNLHPLILYRSIERAKNSSDLFEILETIPEKPPIVWDEDKRCWRKEPDVILKNQLKKTKK